MKNIRVFRNVVLSFLLFGLAQVSHAAILNVDALYVDSVSITASTSSGSLSDTQAFIPPAIWFLGFENGVVSNGTMSSGFIVVDYTVESTEGYGGAPSSGAVDTTLGTIDLSLSDLHATLTGNLIGDFDVWSDATSSVDTNTYDPFSGEFVYSWSDMATATWADLSFPLNGLNGTDADISYTFEIIGYASVETVPVPAAVWLFGSGLVSLIGIARRRKAA
jgi:hypothetical protein